MALSEQIIPADQIEILADGTLQVREATVVLRDGARETSFPPRYRRYVLSPGADLAGRDERIVAVARAVWTPAVIAAWQAAGSAATGES